MMCLIKMTPTPRGPATKKKKNNIFPETRRIAGRLMEW